MCGNAIILGPYFSDMRKINIVGNDKEIIWEKLPLIIKKLDFTIAE